MFAIRSVALVGFALALFTQATVPVATAASNISDDFLLQVLPQVFSAPESTPPPTTPTTPTPVTPTPTPADSLKVVRQGNTIIVTSTKAPTWRLDFAVGSGSPGGGTAVGVYIPSTSTRSVVENTPGRACCSGFALDNLEWRHRPFGGTKGTRAALGLSSRVSSVVDLEKTATRYRFRVRGSWDGVGAFTKTITVTPSGYSAEVDAAYTGITNMDSMWWIISLFRPDMIRDTGVTIRDRDTGNIRLGHTRIGAQLPSSINLPYTISFPLTAVSSSMEFTVNTMANNQGGNPRLYEFWDRGSEPGNYYLFYPRWGGSFKRVTYKFNYAWKLSR